MGSMVKCISNRGSLGEKKVQYSSTVGNVHIPPQTDFRFSSSPSSNINGKTGGLNNFEHNGTFGPSMDSCTRFFSPVSDSIFFIRATMSWAAALPRNSGPTFPRHCGN